MTGMRKNCFQAILSIFSIIIGCTGNAATTKYEVSGPYTSNNLSVYLIHGEDRIKDHNYLTLGEAMQKKKIKVHETSNVNQLSIENISDAEYIYIQAGDIVKGGKQDRVFSTDMVLEPGSGKVKIASFCVEQGRWHKRGHEPSKEFSSSTKKLASKKLKLAARLNNSQSEVWSEVEKTQRKLSESIGETVKSKNSATSLQLTLENKKLSDNIATHKNKLLSLLNNKQRVIGYAFAINGKLNTADIYANQVLMKKLWPKILDSAATESVGEYDKKLKFNHPKPAVIEKWMTESDNGKKRTHKLKPGLKQDTVESSANVRFDTYSGKGSEKKLYRQNYIKK